MPKLQNWPPKCVICGRPGTAYETWTSGKRRHDQVKFAHHVKVDGEWRVEWCYVPKSFILNSKNKLKERDVRRRRNLEEIVGRLLAAGSGGARVGDVQPEDVSRRTAIRYMNELRTKQAVDRFVDDRLPAPIFAYRLAEWAASYARIRGSRGIMGPEGRRYMRLYYETLILKLVHEHSERLTTAASLRWALYRDPHWLDPGPVRMLTERQLYEYLLELIKNQLVIPLGQRGRVLETISDWKGLRFFFEDLENRNDTWFILSNKVLVWLGPSARVGGEFPLYYRNLSGKVHLWVECCLPTGARSL
jgi:hypothetical protein